MAKFSDKTPTKTTANSFNPDFVTSHPTNRRSTRSTSTESTMAPAEVASMASPSNQHNAQPSSKAPIAEMDVPAPAQSSARSPTIASLAKKPQKGLTLKEQRALYAAKAKAAGNGNTESSIRTVKVRVTSTDSKPKPKSISPQSDPRNSSSSKVAKKPTTRLKPSTKNNSTIFHPAAKKKPTLKKQHAIYEATEKASHVKAAVIVGVPGQYAKTWSTPSILDSYSKGDSKSTTSSSVVAKKALTLKEQRAHYAAKGKITPDVVREVAAPKTTSTMKENVRPSSSMPSKNPVVAEQSSSSKSGSNIAQKENARPSSRSSENHPATRQSSKSGSTTGSTVVKKALTLENQRAAYEEREKAAHLKAAIVVGVPGQFAKIWAKSSTSPESSSNGDSTTSSPVVKRKALTLKEQMARYAAQRKVNNTNVLGQTGASSTDAAAISPTDHDLAVQRHYSSSSTLTKDAAKSSSNRSRARSPTREPPSRSRSSSPILPPLIRKPLTSKEKRALFAARRKAAIAAKEKAAAMSGSSRRASADSAVSSGTSAGSSYSSTSNNISGPAPMADMDAPVGKETVSFNVESSSAVTQKAASSGNKRSHDDF
ncbi:hypothetical protein QBC32DRAFT_324052 [Pseudoneurospora amorphoporcata]|uniref:Uncharacterized protein n=1 Tax=Pseudoneurospora amorphoporcata TaxID=241081 RepID=A0AAN6SGK2_9PEZI|nr:hypothetical protein QBC32DRAFT_324052 [Pseudoneurospora amorphoporcata]